MGAQDNAAGTVVTMVVGRYRLLELVGVGGMGRVWRAHDELLDRTVAVKELTLPDVTSPAAHRAAQSRIVREARAAARLDHRNVVRVFDVVRTTGRSWIVMEYVASRSLHDVVAHDGPLSHREAARVGVAVASALRAAHAAGVLHRDVKPHNVLIGDDGRVVLTDFGLATFAHPANAPGDAGALLGSPYYVAPERLRDGSSGAPGDLWSLGATLFTAVEGRPPFARAAVVDSLAATVSDPPHPVLRPGPVHPVIAGLLAKDAGERPGAREVQAALVAVTTSAVGVSRVPAPRRPVGFLPATAPRRGVGRTRVVLAATGLVLAAVVGTAAAGARRDADPPTAVPSVRATAAETGPCAGAPETMTDERAVPGPYLLPQGWRWHRDPAGFRLAVPQGWTRSAVGGTVCFGDPDGTRAFTVDTTAPVTRQPLRYWQDAERAALADDTLPGYHRISMGVLLLQGGGADWEYAYTPAVGPARHVRRLLLTGAGGRAYLLQWSTREQDWALELANQQRILAGLG